MLSRLFGQRPTPQPTTPKADGPTELLMYSRTLGCPFITVARRVLDDYHVPCREVFIDRDPEAKARVLAWTGFLSVPTMVIVPRGGLEPISPPSPLPSGSSPRGVDRGAMITEASYSELVAWLSRHGLIASADDEGSSSP